MKKPLVNRLFRLANTSRTSWWVIAPNLDSALAHSLSKKLAHRAENIRLIGDQTDWYLAHEEGSASLRVLLKTPGIGIANMLFKGGASFEEIRREIEGKPPIKPTTCTWVPPIMSWLLYGKMIEITYRIRQDPRADRRRHHPAPDPEWRDLGHGSEQGTIYAYLTDEVDTWGKRTVFVSREADASNWLRWYLFDDEWSQV